jgi:hypothetical protein
MEMPNVRKLLSVIMLVSTLGACASAPMAPPDADIQAKQFQPPPPGQASLYVFREGTFGAAILIGASLGQRTLGQLAADTFFRVDLEPGDYDLRCSSMEGAGSATVRIAAGETRFVEVAARMGFGSARCAIFEVAAEQGRAAIANGRRAAETR